MKVYIIDGKNAVGKSTLLKNLSEQLNKKVFKEPGSTTLGKIVQQWSINEYIKNDTMTQLFMYLAARQDLYKLISSLNDDMVFIDRGVISTYIFQETALSQFSEQTVKELLWQFMPDNIELCFIWLDNDRHAELLKNRRDNDWMDYAQVNYEKGLNHFLSHKPENIPFNRMDVSGLNEQEMAKKFLIMINS